MREIVLEATPGGHPDRELGSRFRKIRHSLERTRIDVAREIHMSVQKLKRLEDGLQNFRLYEMMGLSRALDVAIQITPGPAGDPDPEAGR
jgi:transcriptional regulator with XRE-family HTH domain